MLEVSTGVSPRKAKLVAAFAAVYVLWGSTYLAIRFGVETIPPFLMAGTRHLTAGVLLYLWTRWRGGPRPSALHWRNAAILGGLMLLGGNGLVTWAEQRVPSGLAALIVASVPIWMAVLVGIEKRARPGAAVIAGLLLGLGGIALLVLPGRFAGNGHVDPLCAAALLTAALCWSFGSLTSRRVALPSSTLSATAMQMIAGGTLLWAVGLLLGEGSRLRLAAVSARSAISLGYLVIFGSLIGFSAYVWLLKATTPARVSTYAYVNPIVAVLLGTLFAGEAFTLRIALAALVIVGAVGLIITARARPAARPAVSGKVSAPPVAAGAGGAS
ncbi:MAG TPA: EamA family transporter [Thermoanaerobaculia bacterium]|nr:EamA family transporter [Thermoanaerobaculia bacterium]